MCCLGLSYYRCSNIASYLLLTNQMLRCLSNTGTHFTEESAHLLFLKPAEPTGGMRRIQGASEKAAIRLVWKTAGSLPPLLSPLPAGTQQPPTTAVPMHNRPGCRPPRASCSELAAEGVTWCPEVLLEVPGKAALWPHLSFLTQMGMCVWPGPPLSSSSSPPQPHPTLRPICGVKRPCLKGTLAFGQRLPEMPPCPEGWAVVRKRQR